MLIVTHRNLILRFSFCSFLILKTRNVLGDCDLRSMEGSCTIWSIIRQVYRFFMLMSVQRLIENVVEILEWDGHFWILIRHQTCVLWGSPDKKIEHFGVLMRGHTKVFWIYPLNGSENFLMLVRYQIIVLVEDKTRRTHMLWRRLYYMKLWLAIKMYACKICKCFVVCTLNSGLGFWSSLREEYR